MPELFTHKHIHSTVWLIAIIMFLIITAGVVIVLVSDNAQVVPTEPETLTPVAPETSGQANEPVSGVLIEGGMSLRTSESVRAGEQFEVSVLLDSGGANINLARVKLVFDPTVLTYDHFDAQGSVLSLGVKNDVSENTVIISRGAPGDADYMDNDDGYTGNGGLFGKFVFTARTIADTQISFDQPQTKMLLDDGKATLVDLTLKDLSISIN